MKNNPTVLLCALNSKFIHSCLAVHSLKKYAFENGYDKEKLIIKEFTVNDTLDYILDGIFSEKTDAVAFSVYIWNCEYVAKLCKIIKKISPETAVILGGPEVSYVENHPMFDKSTYDFIIRGEGEKKFFSFITTGKTDNIEDCNFDEIPFAYDEENISLFENRIVYYETSRGCPFSCAYCLSSAEKGVKFLPLERVKRELEFFVLHKVKQVKFVDRTFNADKKRAYEIWEYIIESFSECDINFHFEIAADLLNDELISLLSRAKTGLIQLEIGIQSTDDKTLELSCRKTNTDKVLNNCEKLVKIGNINIHTDLIIGLPNESFDGFKKSFNDVYKIKSHQLQLGFLKLLHGTRMVEISDNYGYAFSPFPPYEILCNNKMPHKEILKLKRFEDVFEKIYNSQRFVLTLNELEKYFENAFEMFEKITEFFQETGNSFVSVSTKEIFNLLHLFFKKYVSIDCEKFDEILLSDFYFSEKSELVPLELRHLLLPHKEQNEKSSSILHSLNLQKQKGMTVRFIGKKTYLVDYSERIKTTGRFHSSEISSI